MLVRALDGSRITRRFDENGILSVSARETTSGTAAEITISDAMRLETSEVERMIREAELMRQDDEARAEELRSLKEEEAAAREGSGGGDIDDDDLRAHDEL